MNIEIFREMIIVVNIIIFNKFIVIVMGKIRVNVWSFVSLKEGNLNKIM